MKKFTATYHAPPGDSKVAEAFGVSFFDGKAEEIVLPAFQADVLLNNKYFECSKPVDVEHKEEKEPEPHKEKEHRGR